MQPFAHRWENSGQGHAWVRRAELPERALMALSTDAVRAAGPSGSAAAVRAGLACTRSQL